MGVPAGANSFMRLMMSSMPSLRARAEMWSVCVFAKQNCLPVRRSLRSAQLQTRGQAAPQPLTPGTSGVSESQNVPPLTHSKRFVRK